MGPLDLLNLARSSRALHEAIVTRRMKGAWQACLNDYNVPPLPNEVPINEVQLASMLFENTCQVLHFDHVPTNATADIPL